MHAILFKYFRNTVSESDITGNFMKFQSYENHVYMNNKDRKSYLSLVISPVFSKQSKHAR